MPDVMFSPGILPGFFSTDAYFVTKLQLPVYRRFNLHMPQ